MSRLWADILPDCTLQRACIKHNIHYSEYFILAEAKALWRRVLIVLAQVGIGDVARQCWKRKRSSRTYSIIHGLFEEDPIRY